MANPLDSTDTLAPDSVDSPRADTRLSDSRGGKKGPTAPLRRAVYMLLIVIGVGSMLGRIFAVNSVDEGKLERYRIYTERLQPKLEQWQKSGRSPEEIERLYKAEEARLWGLLKLSKPFLSGNDRSRWCTVRVLVEPDLQVEGAPYAIDRLILREFNPEHNLWGTIDKVYHGDRYDREAPKHYYSSKPPLFPTIMAGQYWIIYNLTGKSLGTHPYAIGRLLLVTTNLIPLIIYFLLLASMIERFGRTDWGRIFAMAAAVFGTFLTTFVIVINNHLIAAVCCAIALYAVVRICFDGDRRWRFFIIAGLFASLTAANELPALAFLGLVGLVLLYFAPKRTLAAFVPAVALVAIAFFGTNWIAHQSLRPPYMHRDAAMQTVDGRGQSGATIADGKTVLTPENDTDGDGRIDYEKENWYDYEGSYWNNPSGIDKGEASPWIYTLHLLVGHHGVFSLSPIWLISLAGFFFWVRQNDNRKLRTMALLIGMATVVCLAFYLTRPLIYRNYGGMTCGLRWMFWFAPLWILLMLPALDRMSRLRIFRVIGYTVLSLSVVSVAYPIWNPWTYPWLVNFMQYMGWIQI